MKTLLSMMRMFHYLVGITAPDKKQEKFVLFLWIGVAVGIVVLGLVCAGLVVPYVLK